MIKYKGRLLLLAMAMMCVPIVPLEGHAAQQRAEVILAESLGPKVIVAGNKTQSNYWIKIENVETNVTEVKAAVWSEMGGQDDLEWYQAVQDTTGAYVINVPIINHKTAGKYYADIYTVGNDSSTMYLKGTKFQVDNISGGSINVTDVNSETGTFQLHIENIESLSGISGIRVPVWSKSDQSDLHWYTAQEQSDGIYLVQVNIKNHNYRYAKYYADVYAIAGNGIEKYLGGKQVTINMPTPQVIAKGDDEETNYVVSVIGVPLSEEPKKIKVAVWSQKNGQDDLKWYDGNRDKNGNYTMDIPVVNHQTSGLYFADVYAGAGTEYIGGVKFSVTEPSVQQIKIAKKSDGAGTFDVVLTGLSSKSGVSKIRVPVWSKSDQSDLYWYTATKQSDGNYAANVNIANHNYNYGKYYADIYLNTQNGISKYLGGKTVIMNVPKAKIRVAGNSEQTIFWLAANDVGTPGGVKSVDFAVWSQKNGQDDLKWYTSVNTNSGTWAAETIIANHKTDGKYYVDVYMTDMQGKKTFLGSTTFVVEGPKVSSVKLTNYNEGQGTFDVLIDGVRSMAGIDSVRVAVWSSQNQNDLKWYDAEMLSDGTYQMTANIRNHQNNIGNYYAHVYVTDKNGIYIYAGKAECSLLNVSSVLYPIMGKSSVSVEQMMAYYLARAEYPTFYSLCDAPTLRDFCRIYLEECNAEGVKAEVAFCQAMKETNFLRYGGSVKITQFNFAGIGSTGNGVGGNKFSTVREGIRAQVQHLKAYASAEPLSQACVDPRFSYVARNTAPYTEWLGIKENPYGKGWATAPNYGYQIVNMIKQLKSVF